MRKAIFLLVLTGALIACLSYGSQAIAAGKEEKHTENTTPEGPYPNTGLDHVPAPFSKPPIAIKPFAD